MSRPATTPSSEAALTHVTPGHYPECEDKNKHDYDDPSPAAHNDWYNSPWAYGEDLFLVCWSRDPMGYEPSRPIPDAALGLYVLAADGTRELLWRDGQYGAGAPQPLVPRAAPPLVRSQLDPALAAAKKGEVFISDVARGLPGAPTGTVRRVRVVELYPRTAPDQYLPLLGAGGHENGRGVIGTADVEADGSVRFLVPAEKQLFFQVLDADGFTWRTMRSSTSVMPGERVSCVGCHEPKREASATAKRLSIAMQRPAQELIVPPEGGRPWGFTENVQPIFDRKCVSCHSGATPPKGVALTREEDPRFPSRARVKGIFGAKNDRLDWGMVCAPFSRAYATLIFTDEKTGRGSDYKPFQRWKRRRGVNRAGRPADMVPCWPEYNPVQTTPEGPGNNALGSGLMGHLSRGKHAALLTPEEKRVVATWIDLNALFYGNCEEPGLSRQFRGEPVAYPERVVVTDAGADPTGHADSTPAMQACIDRVAAAGGGTVSVPPGEYRISYLTLRPHVTLELAGGAGRATDGWTPEVAARAMDPSQSAIIRSVADRKGRWWLFLFNLVPPTAATNGFSDITVSGGVFDCEGRYLPGAFACGNNIRIENMVVKDLPNNHAFQIDGCTNVVVTADESGGALGQSQEHAHLLREGGLDPEPERVGDGMLVRFERAPGPAPHPAWAPWASAFLRRTRVRGERGGEPALLRRAPRERHGRARGGQHLHLDERDAASREGLGGRVPLGQAGARAGREGRGNPRQPRGPRPGIAPAASLGFRTTQGRSFRREGRVVTVR